MASINGTEGADTINDTIGDDIINSLGGNDYITVSGGFDRIFAGDGDDQLDTTGAVNQSFDVDMGAGSDLVFVSTPLSSSFNLGPGDDWAQFRPALGVIDTVTLGSGRDRVITSFQNGGTQIFTDFDTGAGGDVLEFSTWYWRNGLWWDNLQALAPSGITNPFGAGRAQLVDSMGGALLQVRSQLTDGWTTIATFQGRTAAQFHADNFRGWSPTGAAAVGASLNVVEMSAFPRSFSNLFRAPPDSYGDDIITGTEGGGYISLSHGADIVYAGGGRDEVVVGGVASGYKIIYLGDGDDTASISGVQFAYDDGRLGSTVSVKIFGGNGNDEIGTNFGKIEAYGEAGDDRILTGGNPDDFASGGDGNDRIVGGGRLFGDAGNDELIGNSRADLLDGGADNDLLQGGGGNDVLTGGSGIDRLIGGTGADIFIDTAAGFNGDTITDFGLGDTITITDADVRTFTFNLSGSVLTYTGGSLILEAAFTGSIVASAASGGGVRLAINNSINGTANNDVLVSTPNDDIINGGGGIDTAVFAATRASATVTRNTDGTITIISSGGTDIASNTELFQFSDGLFSFTFANPGAPRVANFAVGAGGWSTQDRFPRQMSDVNGDGLADIVGFGQIGTLVALGRADGSFGLSDTAVANFGINQGWTSNNIFYRELADVNGDGRADVVGFGTAGVLVSLAQGNGTFGATGLASTNFNPANGWTSQDGFARRLADVNGDGLADIVGFGTFGTLVALGTAGGNFGAATFVLANFGANQGWTSDNLFHREVGDVNGDGRADIVGFGTAGTLVALGQADGTFGAATFALNNFGVNQGWSSQDVFARDLADVNGDGRADIVGFGQAGTFVAFGLEDGKFSAAGFDLANFGRNQGWTSDNIFHRELADVNGDGRADIVGFGQNGVFVGVAFDGQVI